MTVIDYFPYMFLFAVLSVSAVIDYRIQKIPNLITFPAIIIAVIYHTILNGFGGLTFSLLGLVAGIAVFILPYIMGGMGAGDAKLMGAVGAMIGWQGVCVAFLYVALTGGIYAIIIFLKNIEYFKKIFPEYIETIKAFVLTKKLILTDIKSDAKKPRLCYGVAISVGSFIYMGIDLARINSLI